MGEGKKLSKGIMSGNIPDSAGSHRTSLAVGNVAKSILTESKASVFWPQSGVS